MTEDSISNFLVTIAPLVAALIVIPALIAALRQTAHRHWVYLYSLADGVFTAIKLWIAFNGYLEILDNEIMIQAMWAFSALWWIALILAIFDKRQARQGLGRARQG